MWNVPNHWSEVYVLGLHTLKAKHFLILWMYLSIKVSERKTNPFLSNPEEKGKFSDYFSSVTGGVEKKVSLKHNHHNFQRPRIFGKDDKMEVLVETLMQETSKARENVYKTTMQDCKAEWLRTCWTTPNTSGSTSVILGIPERMEKVCFQSN